MTINIHASADHNSIIFETDSEITIADEVKARIGEIVARTLEKTKADYNQISVEVTEGKITVFRVEEGKRTKVAFTAKGDKTLVKELPGVTATFSLSKEHAPEVLALFKKHAPIIFQGVALHDKSVKKVETVPEPRGLNALEKKGPSGFSLIRVIKRFFAYYFTILPSANSAAAHGMGDPTKIRSNYVTLMKGAANWIAEIKPRVGHLYTDDELTIIFEERLFRSANQKLAAGGLAPILKETELLAFRAEKAVEELKDASPDEMKRVLAKIDPVHMPLRALAQLTEHDGLLKEVWTKLFAAFIEKGKLNTIEEHSSAARSEQARWAARLLFAHQMMETTKIDVALNIDFAALNKLVLEEGAFYGSPVVFDDPEVCKQQEVFASTVKEELNRFFFRDFEKGQDAPGNPLDGILMSAMLAKRPPSVQEKYKPLNADDFVAELKKRFPKKELPIDEKTLIQLYYSEAEKIARDLYGFTDSQIDRLRAQRDPSGNKPFSELDVLFSGKTVPDNYEHPSGVANATLSKLVEVTKQLVTKKPDQNQLIAVLNDLAKDKGLAAALSVFSVDEEGSKLADLVPSFVRRFVEVKPTYRLPLGITEQALSLVLGYQKMMAQHKSLAEPLAKAQELLKKLENPDTISEKERLTYSEVGKLSKLARYKKEIADVATKAPFDLFEELGFTQFEGELLEVKKNAEQAKEVMDSLDKALLMAAKKHYRDGDIFSHVAMKKEQWQGRPLSGEQALTARITDYGLTHGMKAYFNSQGKLCMSQLNAGQSLNEIGPMTLYELFVSDAWRVDCTKLVHPQGVQKLKKKYGDNWQKELREIFGRIEKDIHQNILKRIKKGIKNDQEQRVEAGLADYHGLVNLFGGMGGKKVLPHLAEHEQDFEAIYELFTAGSEKEEVQICSEFVSSATLAALMELDKQEEGVLTLPYDRRERMGLIHPGRMITILEKARCAEKVEKPKLFNQLIKLK